MKVADPQFDYLCGLLRRRTGVCIDQSKQYLVVARLMPIVRQRKIPSLETLIDRVRHGVDPSLEKDVLCAMMTHETSFFRDKAPFESLRSVIAELVARRSAERQLTLWSAACSTGQEPYSMAMVLLEHFPALLATWRIRIIATDFSEPILARAREGIFSNLETTRGLVRTRKVGVVAAGHTSVIMKRAGVELPLESFPLQALVSEPIKPVFPCVVMSNGIHAYISQSDKGELVIGAGTDAYTSYTQRGALHVNMHTLEAICELFPMFRRMRMLRNWGGIVDVTPDRSPIIGKTPVPGLFVNCGWGTGGFKATPGSAFVFAATVATGDPHPIAAPFSLERFTTGDLIDEAAAAAVAH